MNDDGITEAEFRSKLGIGRSVQEAEREIASANTFRRRPAAWAVERVAQDAGGMQEALFKARLDIPSAVEVVASRFRDVGLSESAAVSAAKGLAKGVYLSFEDAAISKATFDGRALDVARVHEVAKEFVSEDAAHASTETPASSTPLHRERQRRIAESGDQS